MKHKFEKTKEKALEDAKKLEEEEKDFESIEELEEEDKEFVKEAETAKKLLRKTKF